MKETGFWLAIRGPGALVYDVTCYGGLVARIH
jgi:hypothetical protein